VAESGKWRAPPCSAAAIPLPKVHARRGEWSDRKVHIALADLLDIASEVDPRKRRAGCFSLKMLRSACLCAEMMNSLPASGPEPNNANAFRFIVSFDGEISEINAILRVTDVAFRCPEAKKIG